MLPFNQPKQAVLKSQEEATPKLTEATLSESDNGEELFVEQVWEFERKLAQMNVNRAYLCTNGQWLDFKSVLCFWISLPLSLSHWERTKGFMLFRSLGVIRILRLCNLTRSTTVILRMF